MHFELHKNFSKKIPLIDLPLCSVMLEDESNYPWIFLIPRRPSVSRIMDLSKEDQLQLLTELDLAQNIMQALFQPTQLNVAAIGNKTPQLHVHVIARYEKDPAWPGTVWDHPVRAPYSEMQKQEVKDQLIEAFTRR